MILDDVGVTKKIWSDYILVTFWLHIMVYGYTESDVIAELRGWYEMSADNDVVCVLWICVVVGTESYVSHLWYRHWLSTAGPSYVVVVR